MYSLQIKKVNSKAKICLNFAKAAKTIMISIIFLTKNMKSCKNHCIGDRAKFELNLEFLKQLYVEKRGSKLSL